MASPIATCNEAIGARRLGGEWPSFEARALPERLGMTLHLAREVGLPRGLPEPSPLFGLTMSTVIQRCSAQPGLEG